MRADSRESERYILKVPVELKVGDTKINEEVINLKTSDISSGGAFIDTDNPLSLGTKMDIYIKLPLEELRNMKGKKVEVCVSGEVLRITDKGMALCFSEDYTLIAEDKDSQRENTFPKKTDLLTSREKEVLMKISSGASNNEIAEALFISSHTVKTHVYNIFKKIEVKNRFQAALWVARHLQIDKN